MTFKERLLNDFPMLEENNATHNSCPYEFGYEGVEKYSECNATDCKECWEREMPTEEPKKEIDAADYIEIYTEGHSKGYDEGLNDAWEFVKKTDTAVKPGEARKMLDFFGVKNYRDIFEKYAPQEALAKLKAYEDSKIEVGDVVKDTEGWEYVVTNVYMDRDSCRYNGVTSCGKWTGCYEPTKTGKHIDIKSILDSIGE